MREEHASAPCQLDELAGRLIWTGPAHGIWHCLASSRAFYPDCSGLGGVVIVPALQKATNLSMQHIVPTSLAVIAIVSAAGVASSVAVGGLNWWPITVPFVIGAVAGLLLTGAFVQRFSGPRLQQVFALFGSDCGSEYVCQGDHGSGKLKRLMRLISLSRADQYATSS